MILSHPRHEGRNVKRRARDTLSCPAGGGPTERRGAAGAGQLTRRRQQEAVSVSRQP